MKKLFIFLITIIFVFPVFTACEKGSPPRQTIETKAAKTQETETKLQPVAEESAPDVKEEIYVYESRGRRDPFIPLVETVVEAERKIVPGTLESYDAAEFKLIAIVEKGKQRYGLLLTPDNKSFTVKEEVVLGFHKGKVKKITSNKIIIEEHIKNYEGELKPREIVLELRHGEVE